MRHKFGSRKRSLRHRAAVKVHTQIRALEEKWRCILDEYVTSRCDQESIAYSFPSIFVKQEYTDTNVVNLTKTGTSKKSKKAMAIQTAVRSDPMSTTTNQLMQDNLSDTGDDLILRLSDDEDIDSTHKQPMLCSEIKMNSDELLHEEGRSSPSSEIDAHTENLLLEGDDDGAKELEISDINTTNRKSSDDTKKTANDNLEDSVIVCDSEPVISIESSQEDATLKLIDSSLEVINEFFEVTPMPDNNTQDFSNEEDKPSDAEEMCPSHKTSSKDEEETHAVDESSSHEERESLSNEGESLSKEGESLSKEGESLSKEGESLSKEGESLITEGESSNEEEKSSNTDSKTLNEDIGSLSKDSSIPSNNKESILKELLCEGEMPKIKENSEQEVEEITSKVDELVKENGNNEESEETSIVQPNIPEEGDNTNQLLDDDDEEMDCSEDAIVEQSDEGIASKPENTACLEEEKNSLNENSSNVNTLEIKDSVNSSEHDNNLDSTESRDKSVVDDDESMDNLLQVMEIRSSDEPEIELDKLESNENSCSSTDRDNVEMDIDRGLSYEEMDIETCIGKIIEDSTDRSADNTLTNEDSDKENLQNHTLESTDIEEKSEHDKSLKRQLEEASEEVPAKKSKLEDYKALNLTSLSEYLISRKLERLTRQQLEQLCLQKIVEAVSSSSEIAELRHQLQLHEQLVDTCRKETLQIAKQYHDLQCVQTKLMHELKTKKDKQIVPLKVIRSVGLQAIIDDKRRPNNTLAVPIANTRPSTVKPTASPKPTATPKPAASPKPTPPKPVASPKPAASPKPTAPKVIMPKPNPPKVQAKTWSSPKPVSPIKPAQPKTNTVNSNNTSKTINRPNGSRVINRGPEVQKKQVIQRTSISPQKVLLKPTVTAPTTPVSSNAKVIDLTDEDDKVVASPMQNGIANNTVQRVQNFNVIKTLSPGQPGQRVMLLPVVNSKNVVLKVNTTGGQSIVIPNATMTKAATTILQKPPTTAIKLTTQSAMHPAPLPTLILSNPKCSTRPIPPKPHLTISKTIDETGILLQWKMPYNLDLFEPIASYQLYAYPETNQAPRTENWGKIGDVKALALPMAVTLTQFASGNRYFFAVRAVDVKQRTGHFSEPQGILL